MRIPMSWAGLALILACAVPASAQGDLIWYPFVLGSGTSVTNLYKGGPAKGTLSTTNTTNKGWVTGQGGSGYALSGRDATSTLTYVDTGLNQGTNTSLLTGSMTIAFFMKQRVSSGTLANYLMGGVGSFRLFTGGVAYQGLYLRSWGGSPSDLILRGTTNKTTTDPYIDLVAASKKDWVHVAIVIDDKNKVATWYINGSPFSTTTLTAGANVSGTGNLRVGMHTSTTTGSDYDIDDFHFSNRAAEPHEIQAWARAKLIADKTDVSISGLTTQSLKLDAGAAQKLRNYWIFGSVTGTWPPTQLGGATIPLVPDPMTSLMIDFTNTSALKGYRGILDASGKASASFNMPSTTPAAAIGLTVFQSFLVYDASNNYYDASNAAPMRILK